MESHKKAAKRTLSDSDSEAESSPSPLNFPRFIVVEAEDSVKPITHISPFVIEKTIKSILGTPKSVKKLKNNTILIECFTKQQTINILKHKTLFKQAVKVYPHPSLNSCKGVIRCKDLHYCSSLDDIKENLKSQSVTDIRRISVKRDGVLKNTNTYIITFSCPTVPPTLKIGFESLKVDTYIPNPLRCFKCQRFGHHTTKCTNTPVCARCAFVGADHSTEHCTAPACCFNCKSGHVAYAKECQTWKDEKDILTIKYKEGISFAEARKLVLQQKQDKERLVSGNSYSAVASPKQDCHTCDLLLKLLLGKFPEMAEELKGKVPAPLLSSYIAKQPPPTPKPATAPKPSTSAPKPQSAPKPSTATPKPATTPKDTSAPTPASTTKAKQPASESKSKQQQKSISSSNGPSSGSKANPSLSKKERKNLLKQKSLCSNDEQHSDAATSSVARTPIATSNNFEVLDAMDTEEVLEGDSSDVGQSIWGGSLDDWGKKPNTKDPKSPAS